MATPEKALLAADALLAQIPEHGHLVHIPSSCRGHMVKSGQDNELYKMYRMHYHFGVWAAMYEGQFSTAMQYAEAAEQQLGCDAISFNIGDMSSIWSLMRPSLGMC